MNSWQSDIKPVVRGAQRVLQAFSTQQQEQLQQFWHNSSLKTAFYNIESNISSRFSGRKSSSHTTDADAGPSTAAQYDYDTSSTSVTNADLKQNIGVTDSTSSQNKGMPELKNEQRESAEQKFATATVSDTKRSQSNLSNENVQNADEPKQKAVSKTESVTSDKKVTNESVSAAQSHQFNNSAQFVESQKLSEFSKERKVPASRVSRFVNFGSLAAGLGFGALAEVTKRGIGVSKTTGSAGSLIGSSAFLSDANAERIVNTLCRVRGAALKLGQMLSIQDASLIDPRLQQIFERVRQSADFMPGWQMERVMRAELGKDWRAKFVTFEEQPFAAASIGQVHKAVLHDGRTVAIKIQYPGVAKSIESDINNLMSILKFWNVLPEGLHIDSTARVAKRELAWECDYEREGQCADRFRSIFEGNPGFYVPEIVWPLTTKQILTMEYVDGVTVDKLVTADQETRNWVCQHVLRLCLHELFIANFMQTDPNWSNFLYDANKKRLVLLDFGASREYSLQFVKPYMRLIKAASLGDRNGVLEYSKILGFLTGYENKMMEKAHIDAVLILGEPFASKEPFNFATQTTASRIHELIRVMLRHRLSPPPEESYSLHRKMAGSFLLCAKLKSSFACKPLFDEIYEQFMQMHGSELSTNDGKESST